MRILVIGLLVLALSVAGISAYLIQNYSTPEAISELEKKAEPIKNQILVATRELQPGDILNADSMSWRPWPEESLHESYISVEQDDQKDERFKAVVDSVVRRPIQTGEPILAAKIFKTETAGFMAGLLDKDMRAVSVGVDPKTSVSGFILPGDRVDVLVVNNKFKEVLPKDRKKKDADEVLKPMIIMNTAAETILRNILVLAIDQTVGKVEGQAVPAKTVRDLCINGLCVIQVSLVVFAGDLRCHTGM